ncbi:GNAT family N-acetyltransferase [Kovacikia minuta CCNUW1]|uniref:GNAT family N-acetyltransferase n=1 Tax=Kovacikia minuta TaxID=2931930 RepID=UPI001CCCD06A|nr:GNAT family N-acetyltransferase [Kovacikia minuta]UBF29292.1 GNAT family N-acetyltransferase [Kovacikia minuta CCNUW1]
MTPLLNTERLSLRPCNGADLDCLYQLWTEAKVRRFLFDDRQISREEALSFIEASAESFTRHGYGLWLFFEPHHQPIAGFVGLLDSPQEFPSLIFGTRPQLWGRGYAREAANSVLRYGFEVLGLETIRADVDEPNAASIRVLEALGMAQIGREIVNDRPLLYYETRCLSQEV